jgi:hypothetical protein
MRASLDHLRSRITLSRLALYYSAVELARDPVDG